MIKGSIPMRLFTHPAPRSLYIHLPFCLHKCSYCDFTVRVLHRTEQMTRYMAALREEIGQSQCQGYPLDTIYMGGGTPSLVPLAEMKRLGNQLHHYFDLSALQEWTLEANPETVTLEKSMAYQEQGINRISLGVQSFDGRLLKSCGRTHREADIHRACQFLREAGIENIGFDLIYGLPEQGLNDWMQTLQEAVSLQPTHLSLYALQVEERTALGYLADRKRLKLPTDDGVYQQYEWALQYLSAKGYEHYEVANWALPGLQSQHNRVYWQNLPFLAFGTGAHGYREGKRYANPESLIRYYDMCRERSWAFGISSPQSPQAEIEETAFLNLRLLQEGIHEETFQIRFGRSVWDVYGDVISELCEMGLLRHVPPYIQLTEQAVSIGNEVFEKFLLD